MPVYLARCLQPPGKNTEPKLRPKPRPSEGGTDTDCWWCHRPLGGVGALCDIISATSLTRWWGAGWTVMAFYSRGNVMTISSNIDVSLLFCDWQLLFTALTSSQCLLTAPLVSIRSWLCVCRSRLSSNHSLSARCQRPRQPAASPVELQDLVSLPRLFFMKQLVLLLSSMSAAPPGPAPRAPPGPLHRRQLLQNQRMNFRSD